MVAIVRNEDEMQDDTRTGTEATPGGTGAVPTDGPVSARALCLTIGRRAEPQDACEPPISFPGWDSCFFSEGYYTGAGRGKA